MLIINITHLIVWLISNSVVLVAECDHEQWYSWEYWKAEQDLIETFLKVDVIVEVQITQLSVHNII